MKVLHTVASLQPETGGPARSVPGLAGALVSHGCTPFLWSENCPDNYEPPEGVALLTGASPPDHAFDLIHDHGLWLPFNHRVAQFATRTSVPRLISPRGMLEPWSLKHRRLKKKLAWHLYQKKNLKSAIALHATAQSEADNFKKLGLQNPVVISPNGVDLDVPRKPEKTTKKIVFLSRIHPKKGLLLLVEAWKSIAGQGWSMHVAGPDELSHQAEVQAAVNAAGLTDEWHFHGSVEGEAKINLLSNAELFILPTYSENFGIVVAESLAVGTPVITTTGTPWEDLKSHGCGWWVAPEVPAIQAALIEAVQLQQSERYRMGVLGAEWVRATFSWSEIGRNMADHYRRILHGHRSQ